jgi:hypothetical protein
VDPPSLFSSLPPNAHKTWRNPRSTPLR